MERGMESEEGWMSKEREGRREDKMRGLREEIEERGWLLQYSAGTEWRHG